MSHEPLEQPLRSPAECFHDTDGTRSDYSLVEFWRWALSNLLDNTNRGLLAEYLVGKALGANLDRPRATWDDHDLVLPDGTTLELKATGRLQGWRQRQLTSPVFVVRPGRWNDGAGSYTGEAALRADYYVFCLQTAETHAAFDPLALDQWRFWVLTRQKVASRLREKEARFNESTLRSLAGEAVSLAALPSAFEVAQHGDEAVPLAGDTALSTPMPHRVESNQAAAAMASGVVEYASRGRPDADDAFLDVRAAHPDWFCLTRSSAGAWLVHRLHCSAFSFATPVALTRRPKFVAATFKELEVWARERGIAALGCKRCHTEPLHRMQ